ncbi:hypothetical protein [Dyella sp.]|uniref:hypothetical protein n=1 Tax=Dyella sp. TaxID=1869338 RepID=UPI0028486A73|nr:hypothetical protein [Dyella sp.]MDR3446592.1 hypothetical protein [Dyella sp.]
MSILLRYTGPSVDDGTMNVYDAAANMVAFSDYVVSAAHKIYGEQTIVNADVQGFRRGSFSTDLAFHLVGAGASLLSLSPDPGSVVAALKKSLELFTFLRGEPPSKIEHRDDRSVNVTNNNGTVINVSVESLQLTLDEKAAKAAGKFIGDALSKPGVNQVDISSDGRDVTRATKSDAQYFRPIEAQEQTLSEQTVRMGLVIEEPSFKDGSGHRWTMWDGETSLQFSMQDEDFVARVDAGERFGKGDILICDVRITQTKAGSKLKIQRSILKVHDHRIAQSQQEMDW